jgi:hypothetical protein
LLADDLQISISPRHVGLIQLNRKLTFAGVKRQVVAKQNIDSDADIGVIGWDWALQQMDFLLRDGRWLYPLLPQEVDDRPKVNLILSNHFVRYSLVPWSDLVSSTEEKLAQARHYFQITYGAASASWVLRLSRSIAGSAQLASAVDEKLLKVCNEVVKRHGLRLVSVQPYLMSAFNKLKQQIKHADAWFALVEPGHICLTHMHQGCWIQVRAARLGIGWEEFVRFIARESLVDDGEMKDEKQVLYVYAPHLGQIRSINGWEIHELKLPIPNDMSEEDNSLVMALSG